MKSSIVVIGGLNTDIIALGINHFPDPGGHVYGKKLKIGPGGKSRNIAQMIATLLGPESIVAMVGRTAKDLFNLWEVPLKALQESNVNTDFVKIVDDEEKFPGVALIPVNEEGENEIFLLPGVNNDFSSQDIDDARSLFEEAKYLVLTLELPLDTAIYSVKLANKLGVKVIFDPGGIEKDKNYDELLRQKIYFIKPNEHECKILTGISVVDLKSAEKAAKILLGKGVDNVLITVGKNGGYFFNKTTQKHILAPKLKDIETKDETGCGDQTIAAITGFLQDGKDLGDSVELGIVAGSLQFQKTGIQSVTKEEILRYHQ